MQYQYEWAAVFEKNVLSKIDRGEIENRQLIRIGGTILEEDGSTATRAILERERDTGNLVHLEIRRCS